MRFAHTRPWLWNVWQQPSTSPGSSQDQVMCKTGCDVGPSCAVPSAGQAAVPPAGCCQWNGIPTCKGCHACEWDQIAVWVLSAVVTPRFWRRGGICILHPALLSCDFVSSHGTTRWRLLAASTRVCGTRFGISAHSGQVMHAMQVSIMQRCQEREREINWSN